MKIENSNVSMASTHNLSVYQARKSIVTNSLSQTKDLENGMNLFQNYLKRSPQTSEVSDVSAPRDKFHSMRIILLRRLLDAIVGRRFGKTDDVTPLSENGMVDLRSEQDASSVSGSVWVRTKISSFYYKESESTTFASTGYATCADGRTVSFNVELSMSRAFTAEYEEYRTSEYILTDPLMINLDCDSTSVSDVKFLFDLDSDGEKEEISFAGAGSGFLALDKNNDGIIGDGSELFGTKSGNGFADLAEYDLDSNGWIDENDDIYNKLRIWTKDEFGNDKLINLKDADVGAIYLGSASTDFALTDSTNYAHAFIRQTGIFLRESGGVGTCAQVDLTS